MDDFQNGLGVGLVFGIITAMVMLYFIGAITSDQVTSGEEIKIKNQYYTCSLIAEEKRVEVSK